MIVTNNSWGMMQTIPAPPQLRAFPKKSSSNLSFVLGCWNPSSVSINRSRNQSKSLCCLCSNNDETINDSASSCLDWDWNRWSRHFSEIEQAESYASVLKVPFHVLLLPVFTSSCILVMTVVLFFVICGAVST